MEKRRMTPYREKFLQKNAEEQQEILKQIGYEKEYDSIESAEEDFFAIKLGEKAMRSDAEGVLLDPFAICEIPDTDKYCILPIRIKKNDESGEYEPTGDNVIWKAELLGFRCVKNSGRVKGDFAWRYNRRVSEVYGPWKIE